MKPEKDKEVIVNGQKMFMRGIPGSPFSELKATLVVASEGAGECEGMIVLVEARSVGEDHVEYGFGRKWYIPYLKEMKAIQ